MVNLQTSKETPPIYNEIRKYLKVNWDNGVIICYGDTAYCKYDIPPDKLAHESVHVEQQKDDPDKWWNRYLKDVEFRKEQELEAYRFEADFIKRYVKDRNARWILLNDIAKDMSSSMYGGIWTFEEAQKLIK